MMQEMIQVLLQQPSLKDDQPESPLITPTVVSKFLQDLQQLIIRIQWYACQN